MTIEPAPSPVAYYGKLPARGDFIGRRFERGFVEHWDAWLGEAVLASKERLGSRWLDFYLTSPAWRFVLPAGMVGARCVAGVMIPSVDRVGRYFPLMLGVETARPLDPGRFGPATADWFQALENLAIATLADGFDLADLDRPIAPMPTAEGPIVPTRGTGISDPGQVVASSGSSAIAAVYRGALGSPPVAMPHSLWWTLGSDHVPACVVLARHLPSAATYTAFLNGAWTDLGWPVDRSLAAPAAADLADWERDLDTTDAGAPSAQVPAAMTNDAPGPAAVPEETAAGSIDALLPIDALPAPDAAKPAVEEPSPDGAAHAAPLVTAHAAVDIDDILPADLVRDEATKTSAPPFPPPAPPAREPPAPTPRAGGSTDRWPTDD